MQLLVLPALVKNDTDYDDNIYNAGVGSPSQGEWIARFPHFSR